MLKFSGASYLRQRVILSILSGKPILIKDIRSNDTNPGLKDYEIRFFRLLELLTNGSSVDINYTGTEVVFRPGSIFGGEAHFDCGLERSVAYFLEALLVLAPFSKMAFRVTLEGITADSLDQSIDGIKNVSLRILKNFGVDEGLDFKILKRGSAPLGGGQVFLTCPVIQNLKPVQLSDCGKFKKIRGIAATTRVSPQISNRMVEAARSQLNTLIPDVYIFSDVFKGEDAGKSSGYSLFLLAETTTGAVASSESIGLAEQPVEEMAIHTAKKLLRQIKMGGFFGQTYHWMLLTLMALCPEDLSKIVLGPLNAHTEFLFNDIKSFLGVVFKMRSDYPKSGLNTISCIGSGFTNINRRTQ